MTMGQPTEARQEEALRERGSQIMGEVTETHDSLVPDYVHVLDLAMFLTRASDVN